MNSERIKGIPRACLWISKNRMSGINIHEFLKFFSLQFPTKNIEIAFKVCNFLFALHPPPSLHWGRRRCRITDFWNLRNFFPPILFSSPHFCPPSPDKKAHYIICTDSYYRTRKVLLDIRFLWSADTVTNSAKTWIGKKKIFWAAVGGTIIGR